MKTNAIETLINAHTDACASRDMESPLAKEAEAELAALETENAAMRDYNEHLEAVIAGEGIYVREKDKPKTLLAQAVEEARGGPAPTPLNPYHIGLARKQTTPPTGMVLVEREKLCHVEWQAGGRRSGVAFIAGFCPVCGRNNQDGHADDCWLAALLKEG